jgi:hypothetical protein
VIGRPVYPYVSCRAPQNRRIPGINRPHNATSTGGQLTQAKPSAYHAESWQVWCPAKGTYFEARFGGGFDATD